MIHIEIQNNRSLLYEESLLLTNVQVLWFSAIIRFYGNYTIQFFKCYFELCLFLPLVTAVAAVVLCTAKRHKMEDRSRKLTFICYSYAWCYRYYKLPVETE
jgi:hypothetical protein